MLQECWSCCVSHPQTCLSNDQDVQKYIFLLYTGQVWWNKSKRETSSLISKSQKTIQYYVTNVLIILLGKSSIGLEKCLFFLRDAQTIKCQMQKQQIRYIGLPLFYQVDTVWCKKILQEDFFMFDRNTSILTLLQY